MSAYNTSKLTNGVNVVTYNMPGAHSVAISVLVHVGSKNETLEQSGISHFLEHMAFKGTDKRSAKDIAEEFDKIGGQFNAYTSKEMTVYYARTLAEDQEIAIDILSDILQNSCYRKEDILKEYNVICQEIAHTNDSPDDIAAEQLYKGAFGDSSLGRSILGTAESISKFDNSALRHYVSQHYNTQNLYIAASGKIDHDSFVKLAEQYFNNIDQPSNNNANHSSFAYNPQCLVTNKDLEQSVVMLGFDSVPYNDLIKYYNTQILSLILGGGISSRLFQQVRENLGLAYSVGSFNSSYSHNGLFCLYAATAHDQIEKVVHEFDNEIQKIVTDISDYELERARSQVRVNVVMSEEQVAYKAEEIGRQKIIYNRHIPHQEILDNLASITVSDIQNTARNIFSGKSVLSIVSNGNKDEDYHNLYEQIGK